MNVSPASRRAFTLIELLMSIVIIACLASLAVPSLDKVREKANTAACMQNLRQIGVSALLYAGDNNQTLPTIESWPSDPIYNSDDGAVTWLDALGPYGLVEKSLKCTADIAGPNYFKKEGSSYQWCPMASSQNLASAKLSFGGGREDARTVPSSRLIMAFDYSTVHGGRSNVLFGDGHVVTSD